MKRAKWLQERRMQKFQDVLSRWEAGALSMMEAGELLGMSERQLRRYRYRFEEDGLDGLKDRRLGKASPKRVAVSEREGRTRGATAPITGSANIDTRSPGHPASTVQSLSTKATRSVSLAITLLKSSAER